MKVRAVFEFAIFAGVAAFGHLALATPSPQDGLQSAGAGGADLLQAIASNASVAAMVETWERLPEVAPAPPVPDMPAPSMTAVVPVMSPSAVPVAPQNSPSVVMAETSQDAPPLPMASPAPPTLVPAKPTPSAKADATKADTSPPKQKTELAEEKPKPKEQATKSPAKSSQASRQQSARQAKGSGGTIAKGTEGAEKAASLSDSKRTSLLRKWSGQIRARLAQKAPKGAGKGTAVVRINVSADGRLLGVRLVKSSGNKNVDRLALNAVKKIGRLPKAPAKLQVKSQQFDIPLKSK